MATGRFDSDSSRSGKRFVNKGENIVTDALDGLLHASGPGERVRLDGYPRIKVILRGDWKRDRVAVISGGGAGHEPAHAGFVGVGMLTAAVSGEIFASPQVEAILAGILSVTGEPGCLVIVKNYTGDRLNFGLAVERAKSLGKNVAMVIVSDDVAIPGTRQPRGIAGTLFVHKIAGYLAEQGRSLEDVRAAAEKVARSTWSLGISLSTCSVPGQPVDFRLAGDQAELGLGIHGEPGVELIPMASARELTETLLHRLESRLPNPEARYAVLLNNLGSVPVLEMSLLAGEVMRSSFARQIDLIIGPGSYMTSLDMNGFSVSLLELDEVSRAGLLAQVSPAAWTPARPVAPLRIRELPSVLKQREFTATKDGAMRRLVVGSAQCLLGLEDRLNELDARVGDGDTGSTLAIGAKAILQSIDDLPLADAPDLCQAMSDVLAGSMGGSSGVLLSIFLTSIGRAYAQTGAWPKALESGIASLQTYGGAAVGDRTMIDALVPANKALLAGEGLPRAAEMARAGAEATAKMDRAGAGRSSYLSARSLTDVPDPGAVAVAEVFAALAAAH